MYDSQVCYINTLIIDHIIKKNNNKNNLLSMDVHVDKSLSTNVLRPRKLK